MVTFGDRGEAMMRGSVPKSAQAHMPTPLRAVGQTTKKRGLPEADIASLSDFFPVPPGGRRIGAV